MPWMMAYHGKTRFRSDADVIQIRFISMTTITAARTAAGNDWADRSAPPSIMLEVLPRFFECFWFRRNIIQDAGGCG
jgi:hypothetical protein